MHLVIMYHEVHKLNREGFSMAYISRQLVMNRRTVKKILNMSEEEYLDYKSSHSMRRKSLDEYEDFVRTRLEHCPEASAAQVHDWLKEHYGSKIDVHEKTVFNFVLWVRNKHGIPKPFHHREYRQVAELPYGQQAQVDFGQYNMRTEEGHRKKVYFFSMVLSRSRQKYVVFLDNPFTAIAAIEAHEKCFQSFMGRPQQLVYDQDKLLLHSENRGNLILTEEFRKYVHYRGFQLYFCRKGDPPSKGKVENVIKYIKYNFLRGRIYIDIMTLNGQASEWLDRTANAKIHAGTQKIPQQEWFIEREHLKSLGGIFTPEQTAKQYTVRKDNTISYKSNFYELPSGTYQGAGTTVGLRIVDEHILIYGADNLQMARYKIHKGRGRLISNPNFKRDYSAKIEELMEQVSSHFDDPALAKNYFQQIRKDNPRYIRDQLLLVRQLVKEQDPQIMNEALRFCIEHRVFKATDMESLVEKLVAQRKQASPSGPPPTQIQTMNKASFKITPQKSDISDYQNLMN